MSITEWGEKYSISPVTISTRIKNGWSMKEAVCRPVDQQNNYGVFSGRAVLIQVEGESINVSEACKRFGLRQQTVYSRIARGIPEHLWLKKGKIDAC